MVFLVKNSAGKRTKMKNCRAIHTMLLKRFVNVAKIYLAHNTESQYM